MACVSMALFSTSVKKESSPQSHGCGAPDWQAPAGAGMEIKQISMPSAPSHEAV